MSARRWRTVVAAAFALLAPARVQAQAQPPARGDAVDRALRDELARSMRDLTVAGEHRPYFIAYRVLELDGVRASAARGSLVSSGGGRTRRLSVEVRVGSYESDNTNGDAGFLGGISMMMFPGGPGMRTAFGEGELPLDDDYDALRRAIWLATDDAYKMAVRELGAKQAAMVNRVRRDSLPDFWRDSVAHTVREPSIPSPARDEAEALVRALSGVEALRAHPRSSIWLFAGTRRVRYVNSEGTTSREVRPLATLEGGAVTQAIDGAAVSASVSFAAPTVAALPSRDSVSASLRAMALRLDSLRAAPEIDRYAGPVLFEGKAAAELVAEGLAPRLVGERGPGGMRGLRAMMGHEHGAGGEPLGDRIGSTVLPEFLSVVDDATLAEAEGVPLVGGYAADREGVPARRTVLVERGVLRGILASRTPVRGATRSTGNARGGGVASSNLLVEARGGLEPRALRARLLALAKARGLPWALVVREIGDAESPMDMDDPGAFMDAMEARGQGRAVRAAYRVYPDGREELVRGVQLELDEPSLLRGVVAASRTRVVHHAPAAGGGMPRMLLLMEHDGVPELGSYVVPSLLAPEVRAARVEAVLTKPPLSPPPTAANE